MVAVSISTSDSSGISVIELLLGLSLALCLALGVAPLWASSQSLALGEGDETIWALQGRVAVSRFEKDLRLANATGAAFSTGSALLQATSSQLVLLVKSEEQPSPILVEWEIVNGSLMRRWGLCPATLPTTFSHSLYLDNKTMLEDLDAAQSGLSYKIAGFGATAPVTVASLPLVDIVGLDLWSDLEQAPAQTQMLASALVGR
jgi:Tfp pilus assembly protein PilW